MELTVRGAAYHVEEWHEGGDKTVVMLHGFTGSVATWQELAPHLKGHRLVMIDLLGHGKTESPDAARFSMEEQVRDLEEIFKELELQRFVLLGYSMGGRTALSYACAHPERLEALVLESASPGLQTEQERLSRRQQDAKLAKRITDSGLTAFVDFWEQVALFDSQKKLPDEVRQRIRSERLSHDPEGLTRSLLGMGTGSQGSNWGCLPELNVPVMLITGALDPKFEAIAAKMTDLLPRVQHESVDAGHAIHVEKPAEFATIIKKYLNSLE